MTRPEFAGKLPRFVAEVREMFSAERAAKRARLAQLKALLTHLC